MPSCAALAPKPERRVDPCAVHDSSRGHDRDGQLACEDPGERERTQAIVRRVGVEHAAMPPRLVPLCDDHLDPAGDEAARFGDAGGRSSSPDDADGLRPSRVRDGASIPRARRLRVHLPQPALGSRPPHGSLSRDGGRACRPAAADTHLCGLEEPLSKRVRHDIVGRLVILRWRPPAQRPLPCPPVASEPRSLTSA